MKPRYLSGLAAGALVFAAGGCGGGAGPVKVAGVVTLEGQPVPNATVVFVPLEGGLSASGLTDDQGLFELTTYNTGDGALPGEYKVTVKAAPPGRNTAEPPPADPQEMRRQGFMRAAKELKESRQKGHAGGAVPDDYTTVIKTPLRAKIPSDGPMQISLKKSGT